jgi:hypothetical protein
MKWPQNSNEFFFVKNKHDNNLFHSKFDKVKNFKKIIVFKNSFNGGHIKFYSIKISMQIKTGPTERNMFAFLLSFVSKHIFY